MDDAAHLPNRDHPDRDPRLWLEEIDGERALAWVEVETARTLHRFGDGGFEADRDALAGILDRPDNIPFVGRRGGLLYNFWKDAARPRGIWRRTTPASYASESPDWEVLLDLDALAAEENEDWIWQAPATLPGTHDRAILRLSRGGADAAVLREFDLAAKRFVSGGFALPEAKQGVAWVDRDTLLVFSTLGDGHATHAGYARTVRRWHRGTPFSEAPTVFAIAPEHMVAFAQVDRMAGGRVFFLDQIAFFDLAVAVGTAEGPRQPVDLPTDAWWNTHGDFVAIKPRTPWTIAGATYEPDTVLGARFNDVLAGRPKLNVLFRPAERRSLQGLFWTGDRLVLSILDDLQPRFEAFTPDDTGWRSVELPGMPEGGVADVWALDGDPEESDGTLAVAAQNPLQPATLAIAAPGSAPTVLKKAPATFDAAGLRVTRHEAASTDGERIPYVQVGPDDRSGEAPVLMLGYGGFEVTEQPYYRSAVGKLWLERGGTFVLTHIRGGGEFGTRWHEAGRRENKARSHEDFAAIAADLVRRGLTIPKRIAAEGGSNGGILISNMLTRYPERFGALFCTIPLIDMRRYTKLLAGASWIAEYGDPDAPEDWAFLQAISAYHAPVPAETPPVLIATSRRDDRVHPGHARKMAAKLREQGHDAWFYEPAAGGHGYGKDNRERAAFTALGYAFLRRAIGWAG